MLRYLWQQIIVFPNSNVQAESPERDSALKPEVFISIALIPKPPWRTR